MTRCHGNMIAYISSEFVIRRRLQPELSGDPVEVEADLGEDCVPVVTAPAPRHSWTLDKDEDMHATKKMAYYTQDMYRDQNRPCILPLTWAQPPAGEPHHGPAVARLVLRHQRAAAVPLHTGHVTSSTNHSSPGSRPSWSAWSCRRTAGPRRS